MSINLRNHISPQLAGQPKHAFHNYSGGLLFEIVHEPLNTEFLVFVFNFPSFGNFTLQAFSFLRLCVD